MKSSANYSTNASRYGNFSPEQKLKTHFGLPMDPSFLLLGCERVDQPAHEILIPTKIETLATYSCWIHCQRCSEVLAAFSLKLSEVCKPLYTCPGYPEEEYFVVESRASGMKT
jgi:hypothetical protein